MPYYRPFPPLVNGRIGMEHNARAESGRTPPASSRNSLRRDRSGDVEHVAADGLQHGLAQTAFLGP
jgi:hypothetical protein